MYTIRNSCSGRFRCTPVCGALPANGGYNNSIHRVVWNQFERGSCGLINLIIFFFYFFFSRGRRTLIFYARTSAAMLWMNGTSPFTDVTFVRRWCAPSLASTTTTAASATTPLCGRATRQRVIIYFGTYIILYYNIYRKKVRSGDSSSPLCPSRLPTRWWDPFSRALVLLLPSADATTSDFSILSEPIIIVITTWLYTRPVCGQYSRPGLFLYERDSYRNAQCLLFILSSLYCVY